MNKPDYLHLTSNDTNETNNNNDTNETNNNNDTNETNTSISTKLIECPVCNIRVNWKNKDHISSCIRDIILPETQPLDEIILKKADDLRDIIDLAVFLFNIPKVKFAYRCSSDKEINEFINQILYLPDLLWILNSAEKEDIQLCFDVLSEYSPYLSKAAYSFYIDITSNLKYQIHFNPRLVLDLCKKFFSSFFIYEDPLQIEADPSELEIKELENNSKLYKMLYKQELEYLTIQFKKNEFYFQHWGQDKSVKKSIFFGSWDRNINVLKGQVAHKEIQLTSVIQYLTPIFNLLKSFTVRWKSMGFPDLTTVKRTTGVKNKFGPLSVAIFVSVMKDNHCLEVLALEWNNIQDQGVYFICETFKSSCTLTVLELASNNIGNDGALYLSKFLIENRSLENLHLEYNNIEIEGLQHLVDSLLINDKLAVLSICCNKFTTDQLEKLMVGNFGKKMNLLFYVTGMRIQTGESQQISGEGNYNIVYKVKIGTGNKAVNLAFKAFQKNLTVSEQYKLYKEFSCVKIISHPNVIMVYGITDMKIDGVYVPGMIMELADSTLLDYLKENKNSDKKWKFIHDILQGLVAIHDAGNVHGDLSLDNILLCGSTAKISDFGITLKFGEKVNVIGKRARHAPEFGLLTSNNVANPMIDVYLFGVVTLQILIHGLGDMYNQLYNTEHTIELIEKGLPLLEKVLNGWQYYFVASCFWEPEHRHKAKELLTLLLEKNKTQT